jgi:hypothetical protein
MRKSPNPKIAVLVALIVLAGAAVWFMNNDGKSPGQGSSNSPASSGPVSGLKTYTDPTESFTFTYPSDFARIEAQQPYYGLAHVEIALMSEQASYHPTNYSQDSWLVVSSDAIAQAACFRPVEGQAAFDGKKTVDGVEFRVASSTDAGAGNRYESNLYRTYRYGNCYEIATTLHWASDFNDLDEAAMNRSQDAARAALLRSVESFRFLAK